MERAESVPKIVYWGKPRRGIMLRERDWAEVALLMLMLTDDDNDGGGDAPTTRCLGVLNDGFLGAMDDEIVETEARRTVDEY